MKERNDQPTGKARELAQQKFDLAVANMDTIPDKLFKEITGLSKAEAQRRQSTRQARKEKAS